MNKKRLSVVMAGAMLASSVAPVLALDTTNVQKHETTYGKLGLFVNDLEALMESKKFDVTDAEAGKSVYRFQVLDAKGNEKATLSGNKKVLDLGNNKTATVYSDATLLKKLVNYSDQELTIKVYELGHVVTDKGIFSKDKIAEETVKYDTTTFGNVVNAVEKYLENKSTGDIPSGFYGLKVAIDEGWVIDAAVNDAKTEVTLTLGSLVENTVDEHKTLKLTVNSDRVLFKNPVDEKGRVLAEATNGTTPGYTVGSSKEYTQKNIVGFKAQNKAAVDSEDITSKKAKLLHEVKLMTGDMHYTVKVDDLYDGFMLTDKGHELMNAIKSFENDGDSKTTQNVDSVKTGKGTERYFEVTLKDVAGTKHVVKVLGDSLQKKKLETLRDWYVARKANVEKLAGTNRYATAVEIAKTYLVSQNKQNDSKSNYELVLINGGALVDGLAAAPYAKEKEAPILLTAEDKLPKETKAFMKELVSNHSIGSLDNDKLTVTIVGGESVVSQNVVNELKEIGFKVKRISGKNREETSLAVADKLYDLNYDRSNAFVVGAEGEADAMSIASYAAKSGAPIIVSKSVKGLSTVGLNEVSEYENVEIVGGEGVVPASTEESIKELVADKNKVTRINGKNRFETNALVIKKYHDNFIDVLVAKDGQRNKEELVDALPAALFASDADGTAAPIVLATDKLSSEQLNQLVLHAYKPGHQKGNGTVYQIGEGVNPKTVMQVIVTKLGLDR